MKKILSLILTINFLFPNIALAYKIPAGTVVSVITEKEIDADDVKLGQKLEFITLDPIKSNGITLIKPGTQVIGQVTKKKNNGLLGIAGELQISNFQLRTSQNKFSPLRGIIQEKGEGRAWCNFGWIFIITIPIVFIKGNDAKIAPGQYHILYTIEDISIDNQNL